MPVGKCDSFTSMLQMNPSLNKTLNSVGYVKYRHSNKVNFSL